MDKQQLIDDLLTSINHHKNFEEDVAHIEIHGNQVLAKQLVPGLHVEAQEKEEGIDVQLNVDENTKIDKPVQLCFGLIPENGIQRINLQVNIGDNAKVEFLAHCTFPNSKNIQHLMDAELHIGKNAHYSYFERHVHGEGGGIKVVPKAKFFLDEGAFFRTEFELIKGRVGEIDIDYHGICQKNSTMEMLARVFGREDDKISIKETADLNGEGATGVLNTHIALKDEARADIYNELTANAAYARGHVDCKEIVQDKAVARAVPIVTVNNPLAHVTHEAAIGSVDSKQLQTLMSRGINEEDATDLIIQGLLARD